MTENNATDTAKADPEKLVLRGQPRRVTRFKRHVIIGAAAAVTICVVGAAWLALRTPGAKVKVGGDELYNTDTKPSSDRLASLPASYDKVKTPVLGPPLPGDLGAPIVAREKSLGMTPSLGIVGPRGEEDAARAEQLRLAQLAQQAREAKVMFQTNDTSPASSIPVTSAAPQQIAPPEASASVPGATSDDQNGQQHKIDFTRQRDETGIYNSHGLETPGSPYEVLAGTLIPASLVTGLDSDLPGVAIAQVTQNVLDSVSGTTILIPQGARLIGKTDSVVAFGQSRALVIWQRIVMPDGSSIQIDNLPATDTQGYAGLEDEVDYHTWSLIKGIALSTVLGVGSQLSMNDNNSDDLLSALRGSVQDSANQAGQQITQRNLNQQPTIKIREGWPLRVIVSKDLVLRPYPG
jgi:type IV secretory pathway VirB10-like protein